MEQGTQKLWGETWWVSQRLGGVLGGVSPPHQGPALTPPWSVYVSPAMDAHFPSYCLGFPSVESGSPGVVERLTDNGCTKPGSPQAHKVPCSHGLLVDAASGQGGGRGLAFTEPAQPWPGPR